MVLLNPNKSPEQNLIEYRNFFKKHKIISSIAILLIIALAVWNIYLQYADKRIKELEGTIIALNNELAKKTAEIQRLETQLVPFKTLALEKYPGSESQALANFSSELQGIKSQVDTIREYKDYVEIARLDIAGLPFKATPPLTVSTAFSKMLEGTLDITDNTYTPRCGIDIEAKYKEIIAKYPKFPFSYYSLALCLRAREDKTWKDYALKAIEIFKKTTQIEGHNENHDQAMKNLLILLKE